MKRERKLPDYFREAPANYKLPYSLGKAIRSKYGLGHFVQDYPYCWKHVGVYNNKWTPADDYWISPDGALYSGRAGKILKADPPLGSNGKRYPAYKIKCTDGQYHHLAAHRLVADAYLSDFLEILLPIINHVDGVKGNAALYNLERTTGKLNAEHFTNEIKGKGR